MREETCSLVNDDGHGPLPLDKAPDPFDPAALRLSQDFASSIGVEVPFRFHFPRMNPTGVILVDNTLWDGDVADPAKQDTAGAPASPAGNRQPPPEMPPKTPK